MSLGEEVETTGTGEAVQEAPRNAVTKKGWTEAGKDTGVVEDGGADLENEAGGEKEVGADEKAGRGGTGEIDHVISEEGLRSHDREQPAKLTILQKLTHSLKKEKKKKIDKGNPPSAIVPQFPFPSDQKGEFTQAMSMIARNAGVETKGIFSNLLEGKNNLKDQVT